MKIPLRTLGSTLLLLGLCVFTPLASVRAADHADSPSSANNSSADLADAYFFLDPNDNTRVVMMTTSRGFIVPGEAANMAIFDPELTYQFNLEETGDATPDATITVKFSPRTSARSGQIATVRMARGSTTVFEFSAPATVPTLNATAPTPVVTTDAASGASFFAGEADDPFFFDIPAFSRFVGSVLAGAPNFTFLERARDTFAGYNVVAISMSFPKALLRSANNVTGMDVRTFRNDRFPVTLLGNVSTRGQVGTGENSLIGGIIVSGNNVKRVAIRGIGPSLGARGVNQPLADPTVTVFDRQGAAIAMNDDWGTAGQGAELTAVGLAPTNAKEAALITTLAPGNYTAVVTGVGGTSGVALVEAYDLETGAVAASGNLRQIDREGNPAVNVVLIPFGRKDEYNAATTQDDAAGRFAGDIVATLQSLGTDQAHINILAGVAVATGDYLHLNLNTANTGTGGGNNSGAGFPNGRRLQDDVVDTLLFLVTNEALTTGDRVGANDVPFTNTFPFLGLSQQPRDTGVDDNTRN